MLCFKKIYKDELLQLALILSLLRVNNDSYWEPDIFDIVEDFDISNGTSWRSYSSSVLRSSYVHPKSLDSVLLNYERDLFADLNSLGRYNRDNYRHPDVTAYLLNIERTNNVPVTASDPLPAVDPVASNENNSNLVLADTTQENVIPDGTDLELSQEDMDLIEVLWKQDVDLGFSLETSNQNEKDETGKFDNKKENSTDASPTTSEELDDLEKLKTLEAINHENPLKKKCEKEDDNQDDIDPWAGFNYTIDTETGEYVIKEELDDGIPGADSDPTCALPLEDLPLPLSDFLFDLAGLDDEELQDSVNPKDIENLSLGDPEPSSSGSEGPSTSKSEVAASSAKDTEEDLDLFADMIQTSQFHHHRAFQSRMPFVRTVSMEQRWQDLSNLLSFPSPADGNAMPHPFSHHHAALHNYSHPHAHSMGYGPEATRGVLLHNATLTPPMGDINSTVPYSNIGGTHLGNAVATSMNLTNSSEPMSETTTAPHYKLEPSHDMMYYQNGTSELNQADGFLSSILNDEDLQLMDMAMNEGMYTMRMLDANNPVNNLPMNGSSGGPGATMTRSDMERVDTSSDSAVSSMGSERVPSLSDGEWGDAGSDSGHTTGDNYVDYQSKYRPYDYSYTGRQHGIGSSDGVRLPVAQKKHHMFGKRYFQEQGVANNLNHSSHQTPTPIKYEYDPTTASAYNSPSQPEGAVGPKPPEMKYSCSLEFGRHNAMPRSPMDHIQHNHTYHLPAENAGGMQRPISRDKQKSRKPEDEHLTRDEKRARALNIPIAVDDIINLPMDEFNERLSKYDLSEAQLSLIRDIRRRGKNKVAAQNCRKRKLDQITSLADEVKDVRDRKLRVRNEYEYTRNELKRMQDKYQQLYRHVFQHLRDSDGNPYSPYLFSLQTTADGLVLIIPRTSNTMNPQDRKDPHPNHKNG